MKVLEVIPAIWHNVAPFRLAVLNTGRPVHRREYVHLRSDGHGARAGFCLRRGALGARNFRLPPREGRNSRVFDFLGGSLGQNGATGAARHLLHAALLADGKRPAFSMAGAQGDDIWVKDLDRGTPSRLSFLPGTNRWPVWTATGGISCSNPPILPALPPDGRWLAYMSDESGTFEVYLRPFPGPGGLSQISTGGGVFPLWSGQGREVLFQTLDHRLMAATYTAKAIRS
jgi:Tol biopolymer transport system component